MIRYFVLRFTLFAECLLALWLVGLRSPLPLALLAMVLSSIIALLAFRGQREQAATRLHDRVSARSARIDEHRSLEDDEL